MRSDQREGLEIRGTERKEPSVWHSNPLGLAETLRKREEMRMVANTSHKVAMDRRNQEHTHIKVPAKLEEGKVCIQVPKTILERNSAIWKFALVGRFTGPRPDLDNIRYWATLKWKVVGLEIIALPKGCVLFNFPNQEDMLRVLLKAPWYIGGKGLLLEKWHSDYNPTNEEARMVPVWVQIPNLPLQSWDRDIISSIANEIGKLIAIDSATLNRTRLIHARFCVLLRVDKPIPVKVELDMEGGKWTQDLVYETIGIRCYKCRQGGHLPQNCDLQKQASGEEAKEIEEKDQREGEDQAKSIRENKEKEAGEKTDDRQEDKENKTEQGEQVQEQVQEELQEESEQDDLDQEQEPKELQEENEQDKLDQEQELSEGGHEDIIQENEEETPGQEEQGQQEEQTKAEAPKQQKNVIIHFEDDEDPDQEQGQDKAKRQEARNNQGEEILKKQEGEKPEAEQEEYDEELIKWQKKQLKKERRKEKWRQKNEEQLRHFFPHRYPFRNRYPEEAERRPGRPTNQEMRERESQLAID